MDNKKVKKQRQSNLKSKPKKRALITSNGQVPKRRRSGQSELDFDLQSGDSDPARDILVQIPFVKDQKNLSNRVKSRMKQKHVKKAFPVEAKRYCQNNPGLDERRTLGSSQAQAVDNTNLWKLRTNHVQRIFSMPHKENCPLYSYSRCKKLGIDFNLGSGVKQNLDPNLLTNGIMVEVYNFAIALQSAQKYFIADILEYNFHLNFKNELYRDAFAHRTVIKISDMNSSGKSNIRRLQMPFELPDLRSMKGSNRAEIFCHKCYQDRNHYPHQDESDPGHMRHSHPNAMSDAVSASANSSAQKPTNDPSFPAIEETVMHSYPSCKSIGLNLCVNKDQPKEKLSAHILTLGIMNEVAIFAQKLCGASTNKIINEVLEHNFNFGFQSRNINPAQQYCTMMTESDRGLAWFSEVFVVQPFSLRGPGGVRKRKEVSAMQKTETTKKRRLALQTKKRATLPSENMRVVKTRDHVQEGRPRSLFCREIGLDLDVTSKSGNKEKLDLKLLTRAVMYEIHTFAVKKARKNLPCTVFDILDYNFDLSSQHYRHWDFSIAIASKLQNMIRHYRRNPDRMHEVFELPFVFDPKASQRCVEERQNERSANTIEEELHKKMNEEGRFVRQMRYHPDSNRICFLDNFKIEESWFEDDEDTESLTDSEDMNGSTASAGSDGHIQGNTQIKDQEYDSLHGDTNPEPEALGKHPHDPAGSLGYTLTACPDSESNNKTESDSEYVQYYILAEPQGSEGYTMLAVCPNTEGSFQTESDTEDVEYVVTVEGSQDYSVLTTGQDSEDVLTKEEQDSYIQMVVSDLNQEVLSFT